MAEKPEPGPLPFGTLMGAWQAGYGPAGLQPGIPWLPVVAESAYRWGREMGATSSDADADGWRDKDSQVNPPGPV